MKLGAFKISLIYALIGVTWIALSDKLLFTEHPENIPFLLFLSAAKGFLYVALTAVMLYYLIRSQITHLQDSEKQYRSYFEDNPTPMWIFNRETLKFIEVNTAAIAQYGYTEDEFLNMTILDIRPSDEKDRTMSVVRDVDKPLNDRGIWRHIKKDGTLINVRITSHQFSSPKGSTVMVMATDITKKLLAEQQLKEANDELADTLNSISDAFFTIDSDWSIKSANAMFENISGFKKDDIIGKRFFDLWPHTSDSNFGKNFTKALTKKVTVKFEEYSPVLQKWLRLICYPTNTGIAVYFADITDIKQKDIKLREALERYDLAAKATEDLLYEYDIINNKVSYSQGYGNFSGIISYTDADPSLTWLSIIHPDDLLKVTESHKAALSNKQRKYQCEYRINIGSNDYRYICDQAELIYDVAGKPSRMIGAVRDIHDLKSTGEENKRLGEIIDKINNLVLITDNQLNTVWTNRAFRDFTGYTLEEMAGKRPGLFLKDPDPTQIDLVTTRVNNRETFNVEQLIFTKYFTSAWVFADFTPLYNDDNEFIGYITIYSDISALKEKETGLVKQNELLREIAWSESHEVRKPFATLMGLLNLLKTEEDEEERKLLFNYMDISVEELDAMLHKINDRINQRAL